MNWFSWAKLLKGDFFLANYLTSLKAERREGLFPITHLEFKVKNMTQGALPVQGCPQQIKTISKIWLGRERRSNVLKLCWLLCDVEGIYNSLHVLQRTQKDTDGANMARSKMD